MKLRKQHSKMKTVKKYTAGKDTITELETISKMVSVTS